MRIENELDYEAEYEGRGAIRIMIIAVAFMLGLIGACALTGCSTARDWIEEQIEEQSAEDDEQIEPEQPASVDAVPFEELVWQYGGFNASGATLSTVMLSGFRCDGRAVYYRWDVGLSEWGLRHDDHTGAIVAVFFLRDGKWIGGKFDWVSTSRTFRELKHVTSYWDWPSSGIKLPWRGRVAFVVVSANGELRSNVIAN